MDLREVDEMTLRFSLGDVKAALGEIRERLDDIRSGEVHYRHSGEKPPRDLTLGTERTRDASEEELDECDSCGFSVSVSREREYDERPVSEEEGVVTEGYMTKNSLRKHVCSSSGTNINDLSPISFNSADLRKFKLGMYACVLRHLYTFF